MRHQRGEDDPGVLVNGTRSAMARQLDQLLAKLTPEAARAIEAMPVLTGRGR